MAATDSKRWHSSSIVTSRWTARTLKDAVLAFFKLGLENECVLVIFFPYLVHGGKRAHVRHVCSFVIRFFSKIQLPARKQKEQRWLDQVFSHPQGPLYFIYLSVDNVRIEWSDGEDSLQIRHLRQHNWTVEGHIIILFNPTFTPPLLSNLSSCQDWISNHYCTLVAQGCHC